MLEAGLFAGDLLVANVHGAGGVLANQDGRKVRNHTRARPERQGARGGFCPGLLRNLLAVDHRRRHELTPLELRGSPGGYRGLPSRSLKKGVVAAGSGVLPRIRSALFSATIIVGA